MQKKFHSTKALLLLTLLLVSLLVAGCKKSYASLEDYVKDNPDVLTTLNKSMTSDDAEGKSEVTGNTIIMKLYYKKTVWGQSDAVDAQLKAFLDNYFDKSASSLEQSRQQIGTGCGIDPTKITFQIESYNPSASSPSYTYAYPKQ